MLSGTLFMSAKNERNTKNWREIILTVLGEIKGLEESIMTIMKYLSLPLKRFHHLSNFFKSKI